VKKSRTSQLCTVPLARSPTLLCRFAVPEVVDQHCSTLRLCTADCPRRASGRGLCDRVVRGLLQVDVPKLYNPVTNLLVQPGKAVRATRTLHRKGKGSAEKADASAQPLMSAGSAGPGAELPGPPQAGGFAPAAQFSGPRQGFVFKSGPQGLGYYADAQTGPTITAAVHSPAAAPARDPATTANGADSGWVSMKTVAQLRRERGEGAPRHSDSLYRPIVRPVKKFHALKVRCFSIAFLPPHHPSSHLVCNVQWSLPVCIAACGWLQFD
jgi:hypothetical protein